MCLCVSLLEEICGDSLKKKIHDKSNIPKNTHSMNKNASVAVLEKAFFQSPLNSTSADLIEKKPFLPFPARPESLCMIPVGR